MQLKLQLQIKQKVFLFDLAELVVGDEGHDEDRTCDCEVEELR